MAHELMILGRSPAGAQCTRSRSVRSTLVTDAQAIWWSRSGFLTVTPASSAMTLGRWAVS